MKKIELQIICRFPRFKTLFIVALYEFKHQGHCAAGMKGPATIQPTVLDCRNECSNRPNIGYFAYRNGNRCCCYLAKEHNDYNA